MAPVSWPACWARLVLGNGRLPVQGFCVHRHSCSKLPHVVVGVLELMLLGSSRKSCLQKHRKTDEHTEEKQAQDRRWPCFRRTGTKQQHMVKGTAFPFFVSSCNSCPALSPFCFAMSCGQLLLTILFGFLRSFWCCHFMIVFRVGSLHKAHYFLFIVTILLCIALRPHPFLGAVLSLNAAFAE